MNKRRDGQGRTVATRGGLGKLAGEGLQAPSCFLLLGAMALGCGGPGGPQPAGPAASVRDPAATTASPTVTAVAATPLPPASASPAPTPAPTTSAAASPPTATAVASSAASGAAPPSAPRGACADDMVDVKVACIDRYEAPNRAGEKPLRMQNLPDAKAWCSEHGKRLCTEDEWLRACQGPQGWSYPYGARYDEHACNQDKSFRAPKWGVLAKWPSDDAKAEVARLDQAEPSGARSTCASPEGVFDLTGNVAEWVVKTHAHPEACLDDEQKKHNYVVQGCFWGKCYRTPHEPACGYVNCSHPEAFRSYEFGFRCCANRAR